MAEAIVGRLVGALERQLRMIETRLDQPVPLALR